MSDRDKKLNKGELIDIKSLIGDADGGDFTLDDILAEYGLPASPSEERPSNVVAFPGVHAPPPDTPEEMDEDFPEEYPPPSPLEEPRPSPVNVTPFPKKRGPLSSLVHDLNRRADDYADHMFEEDESIDKAEVRRLERLIPGTDREEVDEAARQWRRPRRQEPPPPDVPPQELARRYGKGLKWMRTRVLLVSLLALLALIQTLSPWPASLLPRLWTSPGTSASPPPFCWDWGCCCAWMCCLPAPSGPAFSNSAWTPCLFWPARSPWPTG